MQYQFEQPVPLSLYIHIPWCVKKCPYCDFNSHAKGNDLPEAAYVDALLEDLEQDLPLIWGRRIVSIFIGGGTPSLFSGAAMTRLLQGIRARLNFAPSIEVTMEANPGTVEHDNFAGYREAGINRLSVGIQSLNNDKLKRLGRIHSSDEVFTAVETAKTAGFDNINLDIMFGLPEQSIEQGLADLHGALTLAPQHFSWYQLTLEPNTVFYKQPPPLPADDTIWQLQTEGQALLAERGYQQYEVSAYSQPGRECQHNLNYWRFGDYLGIGAGAHSKITDMARGEIIRQWKVRLPGSYLASDKPFVAEQKSITPAECIFEFMLNRLRLAEPVTFSEFEQYCGLDRTVLSEKLDQLASEDLLQLSDEGFALTDLGKRFLNDVVEQFI